VEGGRVKSKIKTALRVRLGKAGSGDVGFKGGDDVFLHPAEPGAVFDLFAVRSGEVEGV
jgi:hypothetical protein